MIIPRTTPDLTPAQDMSNDSTSQPVTWQSVFFGIALIALNTLAQEGGDVCGWPKDLRAGLVVSPYICLCDTLSIYYDLVKYAFSKKSIRYALHAVAKQRNMESSSDVRSPRSWGLTIVSRVFLPVAAVLQVVKVLGFEGVPCTQNFAVVYMISFLTIEMLRWTITFSSNEATEDIEAPSSITRKVGWGFAVALILQLLHWVWLIALSIVKWRIVSDPMDAFEQHYTGQGLPGNAVLACCTSALRMVIFPNLVAVLVLLMTILFSLYMSIFGAWTFLIPFCGSILAPVKIGKVLYARSSKIRYLSQMYLDLCSPRCQSAHMTIFMVSGSILGIALPCKFYSSKMFDIFITGPLRPLAYVIMLNELPPVYLLAGFFFIYLFIITFTFINYVLKSISPQREVDSTEHYRATWAWFVLLGNIFAILVYYPVIYSETGTFKPSWTENLGRF